MRVKNKTISFLTLNFCRLLLKFGNKSRSENTVRVGFSVLKKIKKQYPQPLFVQLSATKKTSFVGRFCGSIMSCLTVPDIWKLVHTKTLKKTPKNRHPWPAKKKRKPSIQFCNNERKPF
jgi:hypothetical protein